MSDFDRNAATAHFGRPLTRAETAVVDEGLRAYMLRIYNYMVLGLAITGFAGPVGGNAENPVGTIYLGMHAPGGDWSRKLSYPGPRGTVKQRSVTAAVDWLRRELLRESRKVAAPLAN